MYMCRLQCTHCILYLVTLPAKETHNLDIAREIHLRSPRSSKMNRKAEFWCGCGTNGKAYSDDKPHPFRTVHEAMSWGVNAHLVGA